jgi:hypothetical protein
MLYPAPELPDNTVIAAGWKTVGEIREASGATLFALPDTIISAL